MKRKGNHWLVSSTFNSDNSEDYFLKIRYLRGVYLSNFKVIQDDDNEEIYNYFSKQTLDKKFDWVLIIPLNKIYLTEILSDNFIEYTLNKSDELVRHFKISEKLTFDYECKDMMFISQVVPLLPTHTEYSINKRK